MYTYGRYILMYGKKPSQYCNYPPVKDIKIILGRKQVSDYCRSQVGRGAGYFWREKGL